VLVRDAQAQLDTFSLTPSYLAHGEGDRGLTAVDVPWLSDFGFELSRGFHALKVWMALKEHGTEKFARVIQQNIDQARYLESLVAAAPELEQALPVQLNIVCFRYVGRRAGGTGLGAAGGAALDAADQDAAGRCAAGLDDAALDQLNKEIELELQERGIAVPSVSTINGRKYLHVAVANHRSRREDFDLLVREVVRLGGELGGEPAGG
jgi:glutamate/tyrosine decarboxylase-like PLP-dependent enzyme